MVTDHIAALRASPNKLYARLEMRLNFGRVKFVGPLAKDVEDRVLGLAPALPKPADGYVGQDVTAKVRLRKRGQQDFVMEGPAQHDVLAAMMRVALGISTPEQVQ